MVIKDAYELSCPHKIVKQDKHAPWRNNQLAKLRLPVRKLFNRAKRTGNWQAYTTAQTLYNKEIKKAKRDNFRTFYGMIETTSEMSRICKAMTKNSQMATMALRRTDSSYSSASIINSTITMYS